MKIVEQVNDNHHQIIIKNEKHWIESLDQVRSFQQFIEKKIEIYSDKCFTFSI